MSIFTGTKTRPPNREAPSFETEIAKFFPRQMEAIKLLDSGKIKYLLYGGALGGGKSYFVRWYLARRLILLFEIWGIERAAVMLACEDYPSLSDRQLQRIAFEFPPWLGRYYDKHRVYGRSFLLNERWGSGALCFRNLDDPSKYASSEWAAIAVDELTKNRYDVFTFLRTRLRWPGLPDSEAQFIGATNPGGIGHGWVKQLWMDRKFPDEWIHPIDYRPAFAYVPSKAKDNPRLDSAYWQTLSTLPPMLRKAFQDGDWDIFIGQAFPDFSKTTHVIEPIPIPFEAPIYMTYDWGYGRPFSIGWWWVDADGRLYRFAEWYGWNGTANEGLRMADSDVRDGIISREKALKIDKRHIIRLAGPDCFSKKPNPMGQGQGRPTAEVFGDKNIYLMPGDPNRELKIRQFRERLKVQQPNIDHVAKELGFTPTDHSALGHVFLDTTSQIYSRNDVITIAQREKRPTPRPEPPMMLIYNTCEQFIRTIANLTIDENKPEDVDTDGEDHVYDEACHICMARPLSLKLPKPRKPEADARIEYITSDAQEPGSFEEQWEKGHRELVDMGLTDDWDESDLIPTI